MNRFHLAWLPGEPLSEQYVELCAGDQVTSYLFDQGRLQLRQAEDPDRVWARGAGGGWRQRSVDGRRLDWRIENEAVVVFRRIGDTVTWVTGTGFSTDDVLRVAASLDAL